MPKPDLAGRDELYLGHMLDLARKAAALACGKNRAEYEQDEALRLALLHLVQTIGEAARRVSAGFQSAHPEVPWRQVIGMRHKVVHDYLDVDFGIVWDVVTGELPELTAVLQRLVS
jgi:uncharacterized protein with HEPN domain